MSHYVVQLKSSAKLVDQCKLYLGLEGHEQVRPVHRLFWNVENGDVNKSIHLYLYTRHGTRELHSIWSKYMGEMFSIRTRKYACFFESCIVVDGCRLDQCGNHRYVK